MSISRTKSANVVRLINEHIAPDEWPETVGRAAVFLSRKNLRLGLELSGYVLDAASNCDAPWLFSGACGL